MVVAIVVFGVVFADLRVVVAFLRVARVFMGLGHNHDLPMGGISGFCGQTDKIP